MTDSFFNRDALGVLSAWRAGASRKPLVVRGARQVGKSSLVRWFAQGYRRYAELNLEKHPHVDLFRRGLSVEELVQAIQLERAVPPGAEPLLIFIDEIQEAPEAVAMLRYFHEERPDVHVVAAGSLLEIGMDAAAISFPVGRVQYLYLRPLSFREFLGAMKESAAQEALASTPVPAFAHGRLLTLFHQYAMVGGMPEAVAAYARSGGDLTVVNQVYADLFATFRDDIQKYGRNETLRWALLHGLDSAPFEAGARIAFNGFGGSAFRSREMGEALRTLERAMLLELVYPTVQGRPPLLPDVKKSPRLQFLDIGLVNHRAGIQRQLIGMRDLTDIHRGRLIEQVVGQELKTVEARTDAPLCFWVRDKAQAQAEVDFLLQTVDGVVPVETKSGAAGKLRSLHEFVKRYRPARAVRLYAGTYSRHPIMAADVACELVNIPYYAAADIPRYLETIRGENDLSASGIA